MDADTQVRIVPGQVDGLGETGHVGHDRRAGQRALAVGPDDALVDAGAEAEIVRVDDDLLHGDVKLYPKRYKMASSCAVFAESTARRDCPRTPGP